MSKKKKIIIAIVAVLIVVAVGGYIALNSMAAPPVETAKAESKELASTISGSGAVVASQKANPEIPSNGGTITELNVVEGQQVTAGQVIAKLDPAPLEAQVKQAESALAQAQAGVAQAQAGVSQVDSGVSQAKTAYNVALDGYNQAKDAANNLRQALNNGVPGVTPDMVAEADAAAAQANSAVKQADSALNTAQDSAQRRAATAAVSSANSAVAAAQAALDLAKADLAKATIVAPISGNIFFNPLGTPDASGSYPTAAVGSAVSLAAAPFTIIDPNTLVFEANIDEADINKIKVGMTAEVGLDSFGSKTFEATVTTITEKATTTATGGTVFPAQLTVKLGEGERLLVGMKGDATIKSEVIKAGVSIPLDALFEENKESYVYKVVDDKVVKTVVKTGLVTDTDVEIKEGLSDGDVVAISGDLPLTDGMKVVASGDVSSTSSTSSKSE